MSDFPLVINFQGDYGMKVLMVADDSTMDDVARIAKEQLVGVVVRPLKAGARLVVKRHGQSERTLRCSKGTQYGIPEDGNPRHLGCLRKVCGARTGDRSARDGVSAGMLTR